MTSVMDVPETVTEEMILALIEKKKALHRKLEESTLVAAGATFTRESILITNQSLPDHPIVFANPSFTAVTQYTQEDILGRNCRFLQGPDTDRSQVDAMRTAIKGRQPLEIELLNYRKDKTQFYNRLRLEPFTAQDGTPYYVSVQSDVSAQRERVRQLELLSLALDAAEEAILITDMNLPDNPIIYASAGFTRMTGYSREDIYGKNCRFLQGVDTDRTTVAKIRAAIAASLPLAVEILNYKKDGRAFWNQFNLTPVFDESGKATHYVAVQYEHSTIIDERSFLRGLLSRCCGSTELSL